MFKEGAGSGRIQLGEVGSVVREGRKSKEVLSVDRIGSGVLPSWSCVGGVGSGRRRRTQKGESGREGDEVREAWMGEEADRQMDVRLGSNSGVAAVCGNVCPCSCCHWSCSGGCTGPPPRRR